MPAPTAGALTGGSSQLSARETRQVVLPRTPPLAFVILHALLSKLSCRTLTSADFRKCTIPALARPRTRRSMISSSLLAHLISNSRTHVQVPTAFIRRVEQATSCPAGTVLALGIRQQSPYLLFKCLRDKITFSQLAFTLGRLVV